MITCLQKEWFRSFLPEDVSATVEAHFDVVAAAKDVDFSKVGGLEHLGTIHFTPRSNIVIITGDLGKTRVLETVKQQASNAPCLPHPSVRFSPQQSAGQILKSVLFELLEIHPQGSALLIDDFFDGVDTATTQQMLRLLAHHDKKVVMTVRPRTAEMVASSFGKAGGGPEDSPLYRT